MSTYAALEARFGRIGAIEEAIACLRWDTAAMMPAGGRGARGEQLATLQGLAHEALTAPDLADLLAGAEATADALGPWQRANLREMRRRTTHAVAVSGELVEAASRARSECEGRWRRARAEDDFAAVLPSLARVLALTREIAAAKADRLGTTPYEALVDQHQPGLATATIDRLFDEIGGFLPELIDAAITRQTPEPGLPGPFPIETQRRVALDLMERVGFDFAHGRLDESAHPFCGGTSDDVRITTRYDEADFGRALMAVLHETGHALYQRGLPQAWRRQPVGAARGMAVHESQSLFLEMQVCRSPAFAHFAAPLLRAAFGGDGPGWDADALYRRQLQVRRGLIRVDADEVTYPAHVIMRYRLERAMLAGELAPAELPEAWRAGLIALLGVAPADDRDGCLQDIHWYDGAWGYFPTYTIGALIAAQLFAAAREAIPDLEGAIGRGEFAPLIRWLGLRVHGRASLLPTAGLVVEATGEPLGTAAFERHLRRRYLG